MKKNPVQALTLWLLFFLLVGPCFSLNLAGLVTVNAETNFDFFTSEIESDVAQFSVSLSSADVTPPQISINSPENRTYDVSFVLLDFLVSEQNSWIGYSLDNQDNITVVGGTTLNKLPDGSHSIVVYATDLSGNTGSSNVIQFSISSSATVTLPQITINSPKNTTYNDPDVLVDFSIDQPVTRIQYSLDNQNNVSIVDSIVLTNLVDGKHNLTIYAQNANGNIGTSNLVNFTVSTKTDINSQLIAVALIATIAGTGLIFSIYIIYDMLKNRLNKVKIL